MTGRHITTAVTMAVLVGILVLGMVIGFNQLFAPLPGSENTPAAEPSPTCTEAPPEKGERLRTREVRVNVFNAGTRAGLAGGTIDAFRSRGFQGGEIGNAPEGTKVKRVQVWIQEGEEDAGRLVARQIGKKLRAMKVDEDLAPGVDVVVGNKFRSLVKAPRSIPVKSTRIVCIEPPE
jgi:hypothetical protein